MTEMLFTPKKSYSTKWRGNEKDLIYSICTLEIKTRVKVTKPAFQLICKKNHFIQSRTINSHLFLEE